MLRNKPCQGNSGFTLVEMMVAAAIMGGMAAIAVPNYMKYSAKSRQGEAKIALSAIYVAEKQFGAEWGYFTPCLNLIGYPAPPAGSSNYYAVGFSKAASSLSQCGPTANAVCYQISAQLTCTTNPVGTAASNDNTSYPATVQGSSGALPGESDFPTSLNGLGTRHFSIGAAGVISSPYKKDVWKIDDNKVLTNVSSGI